MDNEVTLKDIQKSIKYSLVKMDGIIQEYSLPDYDYGKLKNVRKLLNVNIMELNPVLIADSLNEIIKEFQDISTELWYAHNGLVKVIGDNDKKK